MPVGQITGCRAADSISRPLLVNAAARHVGKPPSWIPARRVRLHVQEYADAGAVARCGYLVEALYVWHCL